MITLLIATRNAHKVEEIKSILGNRVDYLTLNDFANPPEVVEDAGTFAGNATKKAVELAKWRRQVQSAECRVQSGEYKVQNAKCGVPNELWVLADDSGLEVDALGGAPGVHSARFAALDTGARGNSSTAENNAKLLRLLKEVPLEKRIGRFRCVLALTPVLPVQEENASPVCTADAFEMQTQLFDGTCEGRIGMAPRGQGGFGYDPLFIPEGYEQTFAELGEEVKNRLSHRAKALAGLKQALRH